MPLNQLLPIPVNIINNNNIINSHSDTDRMRIPLHNNNAVLVALGHNTG
jgi:hypothetical protein